MRWIGDLSTRTKLILGFGLIFALLIVVVATAYTGIATMQAQQRRLLAEDFPVALELVELRADLNRNRQLVLEMTLTDSRAEREQMAQELRVRGAEIDAALETGRKILQQDPQALGRLDQLRTAINDFRRTRDTELVPLILQGRLEQANQLITGVQREQFEQIRSISLEVSDKVQQDVERLANEAARRAANTIRLLILVGVAALLVSGEALRRVFGSLRGASRELNEGISVLASAADQIAAATAGVASSAAQTATAISEITTTVEEVKQTAELSSQKSRQVSEGAQRSTQVAQTGRKAVEDTVQGVNRIREQMGAIADTTVRLSEQTQTIGEIIATVTDVADQSNLLAVNSAIEAARAGEQGKGFAVVAQEIKSLAEQSRQATTQVRSILTDIQKSTGTAVMAIEQGGKSVEAGVRQATESGESIRVLADSVAEAAQAATQIAASAQQQLVGMDQVAGAIESIRQASAQNAASAKQTEGAAQNLVHLGQRLKLLVERYRV